MNRLIVHLSFWLHVASCAMAFGADPVIAPKASIVITSHGQPVADSVGFRKLLKVSSDEARHGTKAKSLQWKWTPEDLDVEVSADGKTLYVVSQDDDGEITILEVAALGDESDIATVRIKVGQGPRPPPKPVVVVDPKVVDPLDPNIKPITTKELKVLIIEDVDKRKDLPLVQLNMLTGEVTRAWLKENCVKDATGTPSFRIVHLTTALSPEWAAIATEKPKSLPWLFIQNGAAKASVPLPTNFDDLKKIFDKFSGVAP